MLAFAALLTIVAGFVASHLRIDADLERLLPETAPSVQGLQELERSYGIIGRVNVVLQGDDPEALKAATRDVAAVVAEVEGIERVEYTRPVDFFETYRTLYIDYEDLEKIAERIEARIKFEKKRANPLFVDLSDAEPPEVSFDDIKEKYQQFSLAEYYCNDEGTICVVFAFPEFSAGDLKRTKAMLTETREKAGAVLSADYDGVELGLSGRYAKRYQQQQAVNKDLAMATTIALIGLFLFLLIYFRGFLAAVWVFVPLVMGTVWAFAWAEIAFGSLNVLTGFFGAVLLGLGIDYGIHILSRFLEALETMEPEQAMLVTLKSSGRASVYSGITTVVAFGSLMTSSFRAFFEYGVIALGGMALIIIATLTVLPCVLLLVAGSKLEPRATMSVHIAQRLLERESKSHTWQRGLTIALLGLVVAGAFGAPLASFEYDFRNVQTTALESWRLDEHVDKILGTSQLPVVVLAENDEHAQRVAAELRRRTKELPEGRMMQDTKLLADILPQRQDDKLEILKRLDDKFDGLPDRVKKDELADFAAEVRAVVEKGPIERADLPESIRSPFTRRDDPQKRVVLGFPTTKQHDVKEMEELAVVIRGLPGAEEGTEVDGINDSLLLVDIFDSITRDAIWMISITFVGMLLTAAFAFREPRRMLLLLGTITASMLVAIGLVALFGIKFNFINIVVVPIWLGLGVDAAFHLMIRHEESPGEVDGFLATGLAVGAAFVTSMIGFGAMLVSSHKGLFSMGAIAVVGLGSILVTSLVVQGLVLIRHIGNDDSGH